MKPTIKIYIGAPVSGTEANAVKRLYSELSERGINALLFVNFTAKRRQIDCVVVTTAQATLLDFKEITGPLRGGVNGKWFIRTHGGSERPYPGENPYVEVSTAKYALSDEMAVFQKRCSNIPAPRKSHFYAQFDAAVCICPDIVSGSTVCTGDFKCWIWGFPTAVEKICTRRIESSWSLDHWVRFANEHLALEIISVEGATDSAYRKAEQTLSVYSDELTTLLSYSLPPELPSLPERLPDADHFVLVGLSGIGKTVRLQHHALECAKHGLVLFLEAMHYTGDFRKMLQKGVAPSFAGKVEELLNSASDCAVSITLIVDGFDRCKEAFRAGLIVDIVAFQKRYPCRVVLGSKFDPNLPPSIRGQLVRMVGMTLEQKVAVFQFYAGNLHFSDPRVLEPFETAHDLMVAGRCRSASRSGTGFTRTELYDAYVIANLPPDHTTVVGALCRHIAAELSREFAATMSLHEFDQMAESFLESCGAPLHLVDEIRSSGLLNLSSDNFSFRHELIQEHFFADWLYRSAETFDLLLSELQKPAYRHLAQSALSRQKDPRKARAILQLVPDAEILMDAFRGRCGSNAREVILADCHRLLRDAAVDLVNLKVTVKTDPDSDTNLMLGWPELDGSREWSDYEVRLAICIGRFLNTPDFATRVSELFVLSGATLSQMATKSAQELGLNPLLVFDRVLHSLLVLERTVMTVPVSKIFHAFRYSMFASKKEEHRGEFWTTALFACCSTEPQGRPLAFVIFALCESVEYSDTLPVTELERLFHLAWNTRLRSVRCRALEMLESSAGGVLSGPPEDAERVRRLLAVVNEKTSGRDLLLNSFLLEAMNAYNMISLPVGPQEALRQMRGILNLTSDYAKEIVTLHESFPTENVDNPLAEEAYRILGMFFEDLFQGVYLETFDTLTTDEQVAFMNLAAQAKDPSFHLSYIMEGLVKAGSASSLPVFRRYASGVRLDLLCWQDAVGAFILAIIACSKLHANLPPWETDKHQADAWYFIRDIVYNHFNGAAKSEMDCLWISLRAEAPLAIADAFARIEQSFIGDAALRFNPLESYPQEMKAILEHSLLNLPKLTSASGASLFPESRADFVITSLGRIGDQKSAALLKEFTGDSEYGHRAIAAIRAIRERLAIRGPTVIRWTLL